MNIDLGSLFFNASIESGGGTPSWGTALGQSAPDYKFTYPGASDILVAMDYCYCPLSNEVSCKLGKGGKEYKAIDSRLLDSKYEIIKAALFCDVQVRVENRLISIDHPLALLVTKENESTHKGRRTLKYSDSIRIGEFCNKDFYDSVQEVLGPNVCWFAYAIDVVNQSKLTISVIKVSDNHMSYDSPESRKRAWTSLLQNSVQIPSGSHSFFFNSSSDFIPAQIIYYGVPGSGKSHSVDVEINNRIAVYNANKDDNDKLVCAKQVIRTVFHPDYCYTDFIGQIMPKKNSAGEFKYEFKPGPFARIIRNAYLNPQKPYFLVIEEINRGNAAAIFGETFQLLDRYVTGETSKTEEVCNENYGYSEGWSRYPINNDELNEYILQGGESSVTEKEPGVEYDSDFADGPQAAIKIPSIGLHFSSYCGIRLPPNLSIYATMNTSDQNVFTLDNAFQRRWTMKQISSELENTGASADQYNQTIKRNAKDKDGKNILVDTNVKWGDFRKAINEVIMESALENGLSSMEDKRLGGWFYVKSDNFAEKVLKYLWDDAFKFSRSDHFGKIRTLEELVEKFNEQGFDVFADTSISDLQPPKSSSSSSDEV